MAGLYIKNFPQVGSLRGASGYLSFSISFLKSFCGGLGSKPWQEHRESSSDPKPLYGGTGLAGLGAGGALYCTGVKSSSNPRRKRGQGKRERERKGDTERVEKKEINEERQK